MLVMDAIAALGGKLTREVATGLLTAISMDTGWFRHTNTRPGTLRAGAKLIEAGADIAAIYRELFERNTLGRLRLMGRTLTGLQTDLGGRVAYTTISRDDLAGTGAIPQDSEDLVDFTVSLGGVEVGALFIEQARGGIKVSLRSRAGFDCARLAATLGGGGHRAAAGVILSGPMTQAVDDVLRALRQALEPSAAHPLGERSS
jgi:phosphoesterase RecJ-like protein